MSHHTSDVYHAEFEEITCDIAEDLEFAASRDAPPSRMSHGTHMNVSCHTYEWVMSHMKTCHFTNHTWLTHLSNSYQAEFEEITCEIAEDLEIAENIILEHAFVTYICCTSNSFQAEFEEITCEIPEDLEIAASRDAPLVLAFWSELVTETRSAGKNESRHACGSVTWHIWTIHVTHANESCHTCEWVMSHVRRSHVTHEQGAGACFLDWTSYCVCVCVCVCVSRCWSVAETFSAGKNESCHTREWVMSHLWMSPLTHVNESCHTCKWVMSHVWMSHVTRVN